MALFARKPWLVQLLRKPAKAVVPAKPKVSAASVGATPSVGQVGGRGRAAHPSGGDCRVVSSGVLPPAGRTGTSLFLTAG